MSKSAKSHNVFGGIILSDKPLKMDFKEFSMTEFISAEVFTKDHKGKDLPKMSVDSFIHFSISERLHVDKKFFSKHPDFKFDKLNDRIRTQVNEYIKEHNTSDLLFTEKHVKYIRNCYAFLLGKYDNTHMEEKFGGYNVLIEYFIFDFDQDAIEDVLYSLFVEEPEKDTEEIEPYKNSIRNDIFHAFNVVTLWAKRKWKLYLEEKAVEEKTAKEVKEKQEAEEAARRKEQIENCINIQRFGAEYQKPLTYDVQPIINQHRRMNQKGKK